MKKFTFHKIILALIVVCILLAATFALAWAANVNDNPDLTINATGTPLFTNEGNNIYKMDFSLTTDAGLSSLELLMSYDNTVIQPVRYGTYLDVIIGPAEGSTSTTTGPFSVQITSASLVADPYLISAAWKVYEQSRTGYILSLNAPAGQTPQSSLSDELLFSFYFRLADGKTWDDVNVSTFQIESNKEEGSFIYDYLYTPPDTDDYYSIAAIRIVDAAGAEDTLNDFHWGLNTWDEGTSQWVRQPDTIDLLFFYPNSTLLLKTPVSLEANSTDGGLRVIVPADTFTKNPDGTVDSYTLDLYTYGSDSPGDNELTHLPSYTSLTEADFTYVAEVLAPPADAYYYYDLPLDAEHILADGTTYYYARLVPVPAAGYTSPTYTNEDLSSGVQAAREPSYPASIEITRVTDGTYDSAMTDNVGTTDNEIETLYYPTSGSALAYYTAQVVDQYGNPYGSSGDYTINWQADPTTFGTLATESGSSGEQENFTILYEDRSNGTTAFTLTASADNAGEDGSTTITGDASLTVKKEALVTTSIALRLGTSTTDAGAERTLTVQPLSSLGGSASLTQYFAPVVLDQYGDVMTAIQPTVAYPGYSTEPNQTAVTSGWEVSGPFTGFFGISVTSDAEADSTGKVLTVSYDLGGDGDALDYGESLTCTIKISKAASVATFLQANRSGAANSPWNYHFGDTAPSYTDTLGFIPGTGTSDYTYTLKVYDQFGDEMAATPSLEEKVNHAHVAISGWVVSVDNGISNSSVTLTVSYDADGSTVIEPGESFDIVTALTNKTAATITLDNITKNFGETYSISPIWPTDGTGTTTEQIVIKNSGDTEVYSWTKVGEAAAVETGALPTAAGSYTIVATYENDTHYGTNSATLTIHKVDPTVAITKSAAATYTYTGSPLPITLATLPQDAYSAMYGGSEYNSAGDLYTSANVTLTYYTDSACTQLTGATGDTVSGVVISPANEGTAPINIGTYYVKATFAATTNFNAATTATAVSYTIGKGTPTIEVQPAVNAITYEQTLSTATFDTSSASEKFGGAEIDGSYAWLSDGSQDPTDIYPTVGGSTTYTVVFTPSNSNLNTVTFTKTAPVNAKALAVAWTGDSGTYYYDGSDQGSDITAAVAADNGWMSGKALSVSFEGTSGAAENDVAFLEAGGYDVTASLPDTVAEYQSGQTYAKTNYSLTATFETTATMNKEINSTASTDAAKTVTLTVSKAGQTGLTWSLASYLPTTNTNFTGSVVLIVTDRPVSNSVLSGDPALSGDKTALSYSTAASLNVGDKDTFKLKFTSDNQADYYINVEFEVVSKGEVTVSGGALDSGFALEDSGEANSGSNPWQDEYDGGQATCPTAPDTFMDGTTPVTIASPSFTYTWYAASTFVSVENPGTALSTGASNGPKDAGDYVLVIELVNDDYEGAQVLYFEITKKAVTATLSSPGSISKPYDGDTAVKILSGSDYVAVNLVFTVSSANLAIGDSVTVTVTGATYNNANVGIGKAVTWLPANENVTGTGTDNYSVTLPSVTGTITAVNITGIDLTSSTKTYTGSGQAYGGLLTVFGVNAESDTWTTSGGYDSGSIFGTVTLSYLKKGTETVAPSTGYSTTLPGAAGTYWVKVAIAANGNYNAYTGAAYAVFTIEPKALATGDLTIQVDDAAYGGPGVALEPDATIRYGATALVEGTDYSLLYSNNTTAGTGTVTVTLQGNYSNDGAITANFTIEKADLTIRPDSFTITQGDALPDFEWEYRGLFAGDNITNNYGTLPTLSAYDGSDIITDSDTPGEYTITFDSGITAPVSGDFVNDNYTIIVETSGVLTIEEDDTLYSNEVTVEIYGEEESIDVTGEVTGDTILLDIDNDDLYSILRSRVKTGVVCIDLRDAEQELTTVILPYTNLKEIYNAILDEDNDVTGLQIRYEDGSIEFDAEAVIAIYKKAGSHSVSFTLESYDSEDLPSSQEKVAGDAPVYRVEVKAKSTITDLDGGKMNVCLYYRLGSKSEQGLVVYELEASGPIHKMDADYLSSSKMVCFSTIHVGSYALTYDATLAEWSSSYSDVNSSSWFFTYVRDLSLEGVVNGYPDGSFGPNREVSYGEALKLIMLASGYSVQAPTGSHWASGYLTRAEAEGLVAQGFITNLDAAITRGVLADIAAKALHLGTVSRTSPFVDTELNSVLALYSVNIVEGSFDAAGNRVYKPDSPLTRAEITTIIWRIHEYVY